MGILKRTDIERNGFAWVFLVRHDAIEIFTP
jgi:hypothetical protein